MKSNYWLGLAKEYEPSAQHEFGQPTCGEEYQCDCLAKEEVIEELACYAEWLARKWGVIAAIEKQEREK